MPSRVTRAVPDRPRLRGQGERHASRLDCDFCLVAVGCVADVAVQQRVGLLPEQRPRTLVADRDPACRLPARIDRGDRSAAASLGTRGRTHRSAPRTFCKPLPNPRSRWRVDLRGGLNGFSWNPCASPRATILGRAAEGSVLWRLCENRQTHATAFVAPRETAGAILLAWTPSTASSSSLCSLGGCTCTAIWTTTRSLGSRRTRTNARSAGPGSRRAAFRARMRRGSSCEC